MPERLLYAISSSGKMSFSNYDNAFSSIYYKVYKTFPEDISFTFVKYQTLRLLDALCHCDFDFGKRYVYVCQPTLILLPSFGLPKFLLVGARNPQLIYDLRRFVAENRGFVSFNTIPQHVQPAMLPPAIYLETVDKDLILKAAKQFNIRCNADNVVAWSIVNFSMNISELDQTLSFESREEPNWPKRSFITADLGFSRYKSEENEIKLIEYTNPRDQQRLYFLWHGNKAAEVDRDWGLFLLFYKLKRNIMLYDPRKFLLAIPENIYLPRLISRSLSLCTGLAPLDEIITGKPSDFIPFNCRFHIYQSVIPPMAETVSVKLGQALINYDIDLI